jgi:hypothetical protein
MVKWDDLCKPKLNGGLGLQDLVLLNQVMGEKTWWRWLKHLRNLRVKIWKNKYACTMEDSDLIRWNEKFNRSLILNKT